MSRILLVLYLSFCICFTIFTYLYIDPNFIYLKAIYSGRAFTNRVEVTVGYVVFIVLFFTFYFSSLRIISKHKKKKFLVSLLLVSTLLIFSYPTILSYDIFNYIATSKVMYFYRENPYLIMPNEFLGDPILLFTRASNKLALYGISWLLLSFVPYILSFGSYLLSIFLFKFFEALFYLGLVVLIYKLSNKNILRTAMFALNPLVIIETFISGHNDVVMMFFAMLSFFLLKKNKKTFAFSAFFIATLVKYSVIFLVPIIFYLFIKSTNKSQINWSKIWLSSCLLMSIIFFLSPLREEMYPWYAIWVLPFAVLSDLKILDTIAYSFSFGLLLSYVPYMITGVYSKNVLTLKYLLSFVFIIPLITYEFFKKNIK